MLILYFSVLIVASEFCVFSIFCIMASLGRKMLIDGEVENSNEGDVRYDFDLFVIGAGSGGVRAARFSAQSGAKVLP